MKIKAKILSAFSILLVAPIILSSCSMFREIMEEIKGESSSSDLVGETNFYEEEYVDFNSLDVKPIEKLPTTETYRLTDDTNYTYYELGNNNAYNSQYARCIGEQKTLIIPVSFSDHLNYATEEARLKLVRAFFGTPQSTGWESVASYFYKSSYGKLKITGTVAPWYSSGMSASQFQKEYIDSKTDKTLDILHDAVIWAKKSGFDMKDYDLDHDGYIDSVWLVYGAPYLQQLGKNPFWAYTYWARQSADKSSPMENTYAWASIDFMSRGISNPAEIDAHTYIHEHGHVMGLDDYYDYDDLHSPLGLYDMQDANVGDHCAYSKWAWGWVNPVVPTADGAITIKPFESSGQCIAIKNPESTWRGNAFDEYLLLELLTPTGLWSRDATVAYPSVLQKTFEDPGVRITHVDGRLFNYDGRKFLDSYENKKKLVHAYSNTVSDSYTQGDANLRDDLLAIINKDKSLSTQLEQEGRATTRSLFKTGDVFTMEDYNMFFHDNKMHDGSYIPWKITFENVSKDSATIRFEVQ